MYKFVSDYAHLMYTDKVTRDMLELDGEKDVDSLDISKLSSLATYFPCDIKDNPFARIICKKAQGENYDGNIDAELYRRICKGFGILVV